MEWAAVEAARIAFGRAPERYAPQTSEPESDWLAELSFGVLQEIAWIPDLLCELAIQITALIQISLLEFFVRSEIHPRSLDELQEARVMVVCLRVQRTCKKVLCVVVGKFLVVGEVAIARIELLGQEQEATDPVSVLVEVGLVAELVAMASWMVGPDVLDFVAVAAFAHIFRCSAMAALTASLRSRSVGRVCDVTRSGFVGGRAIVRC